MFKSNDKKISQTNLLFSYSLVGKSSENWLFLFLFSTGINKAKRAASVKTIHNNFILQRVLWGTLSR